MATDLIIGAFLQRLRCFLIKERRIEQLKTWDLDGEKSAFLASEDVTTSHRTYRILNYRTARIFKPLSRIEGWL